MSNKQVICTIEMSVWRVLEDPMLNSTKEHLRISKEFFSSGSSYHLLCFQAVERDQLGAFKHILRNALPSKLTDLEFPHKLTLFLSTDV